MSPIPGSADEEVPGLVSTPQYATMIMPRFGGGEVNDPSQSSGAGQSPNDVQPQRIASYTESFDLTSPLPEGLLVKCRITRDSGSMLAYPSFRLHSCKDDMFLMA